MLKMAYHTTYHLFILFLNVWNFTHFFFGFPKVLEVYKNCVTQYFIFEKKIDYGNWLHNRLFVHGQTKTHYDLLVRFRTECK